jgi:hypothetical protein
VKKLEKQEAKLKVCVHIYCGYAFSIIVPTRRKSRKGPEEICMRDRNYLMLTGNK